MKTFAREHWLFILILLSATALRFFPLFEYQYTYDEWSGLFRTPFNSFGDVIEKGVKIDAHPAFVQVLIYYLAKAFGYTDWIIKLPFLLFSLGAIIYAYAFCLRNFSKQAALFAAVAFSYSLVFVYYAPIARMYISGVFFSLGLLYHFGEVFFLHNSKIKHFILIALFALLSALNQHINSLFAFTVCATGLLYTDKKTLKPYLITCAATVLLYLPHLPVTIYQLGVGGIGFEQDGWLPVPKWTVVFDFIQVILGTGRTYMVVGALIVLALILGRAKQLNRVSLFLAVLFLINYLIIFFYSVYRAPVYQHSVMLFAGSGFLLAIAAAFNFQNKLLFSFALTAVAVTLLFKTYFKKDYLHQCVQNIFEYQFQRTAELKSMYGAEKIYPLMFDADTFMKKVCFEKYKSSYPCSITGDKEVSSLKDFAVFLRTLKTRYIALASSFPHYQAVAREQYPYLVENHQTQGLNFKVYSNDASDANKTVGDDNLLFSAWPNKPSGMTFTKNFFGERRIYFPIDSVSEYPFTASAPFNVVTSKEGQMVMLKAELKLKSLNPRNIMVCLSANDPVTDSIYSYNITSVNDFIIKSDSTVNFYTGLYCGTNYNDIKNKSLLKAYIWNRDKENFTLLNFEVSTIDFWPQKWNYWK